MSFRTELKEIDFRNQLFSVREAEKCIKLVTSFLELYFDKKKEEKLISDLSISPVFLDELKNIKTNQMKDFLVQAENICIPFIRSEKDIIYSLFAGRFVVLQFYYDISKYREKMPYEDVFSIYQSRLQKGEYSIISKNYSEDELKDIFSKLNIEKDWSFDYGSINHWKKSYLLRQNDEIKELLQEVFVLSALSLASVEKKPSRLSFAKKFYHVLSYRHISLASPLLLNFRKDDRKNLSSCFILKAAANSSSIGYSFSSAVTISRQNGGVGVYLGHLDDMLYCCKIFNDLSVGFSQDGLTQRQSAITVATEIWHIDILKFLDLQLEVGDQRLGRCYDIFPQLVIPDEFMKKLLAGLDWYLFVPSEIIHKYGVDLSSLYGEEFSSFYNRIISDIENNVLTLRYRKVKSVELISVIMQRMIETGLPYLFFKCQVNRVNPNKHLGVIPCGNLCQESYSNIEEIEITRNSSGRILEKSGATHTCNLCSINLCNALTKDEIAHAAKLGVRILDNAIKITQNPIFSSFVHNKKYRTIGVGVMGLHDYFVYHGIEYEYAAKKTEELFEFISLHALEESVHLAKIRSSCPSFPGSELSNGIFCGKHFSTFKTKFSSRWQKLFEKMSKFGIRNSQVLAIAPTSSTSIMMGATASVLPVYDGFMIDSNNKGFSILIPRYSLFSKYKSYKDMDLMKVIDVISSIQKFIDQGISFELLFDLNKEEVDAVMILKSIVYAWRKGTKALYYTRTIQKQNNNISEKKECQSCSL